MILDVLILRNNTSDGACLSVYIVLDAMRCVIPAEQFEFTCRVWFHILDYRLETKYLICHTVSVYNVLHFEIEQCL